VIRVLQQHCFLCCDLPTRAVGASRENNASAHSARPRVRVQAAPSEFDRVLVSIALVYSQHDCDARSSDYRPAEHILNVSGK